jgi:DNA-binding beta-propeller fold protein YncE
VSTNTQDEIGTDFVGYRIEALIGRGGMGVVYRAYDLRLKRTVALKLVAPELALDERFRARFARESELAMSLEHPNVIPIYDAGDVDGRLYLAMRHVEGSDLRELLRAEGKLEPTRALAICGQVGAALDGAHAQGLVHRDVKPSNVLLDQDEHVYVADLGLTRRLEEQGPRAGEERSVGTPAYLAPEQIEGHPVDGRADIYSLGCLLYECLAGEPPFAADSRLAVAWAHLEEEPPNASGSNPDLPEAIDAVIRKAIAKAPEERYPTSAALIAQAEAALGLRQPPIFRRGRLLLLAGVAILALVAAAVAAALFVRGTRDANVSTPLVRPNTLVRINPLRNAISDVIPVGLHPEATVVGGRSVWVYNHGRGTVMEIDAGSNAIRQEVRLSTTPVRGRLTGPILDADEAAAWIVGADRRGDGFLTRILARGGGKREYRLDVEPKAVALGDGAVWVLGHGSRGDQVLRLDPGTGKVGARTPFPASVHLGSLTVGLGAVWAVASSTAILYRIDPRSSKLTRQRDLGERAGRPVVRFGHLWVPVLGQETLILDPRTLDLVDFVCCSERGFSAAGYGSTWLADVLAGEVVRFDGRSKQITATIPVVTGSPFWGHPCLSSIAAGAGGVWVTVVPSVPDSSHSPPREGC